jgi:hypothetical protein
MGHIPQLVMFSHCLGLFVINRNQFILCFYQHVQFAGKTQFCCHLLEEDLAVKTGRNDTITAINLLVATLTAL